MNSIRVRFTRGDEVKFISHLDLMKVFERAIRRAGLPIAYSQGFNPHPQMVFGLPLSVGVSSEAEYADFELTKDMTPEAFAEKLNTQLPKGLRILEGKWKQGKENIMSAISAASYNIQVSLPEGKNMEWLEQKILELLQLPSVIVKKEGKKGVRDVDIKPLIYRLELDRQDGSHSCRGSVEGLVQESPGVLWISLLAAAGSAANMRPELMITALQEVAGLEIKILKLHRTGLFIAKEGNFFEPLNSEVV